MMNNFIRNPVLRLHTPLERNLFLVCTLANTSPCPLFYASYHLLYLRRDSNSHLVVRSHRFYSVELRRYVVCMMGHDPTTSTFTEWHSTNWATYTIYFILWLIQYVLTLFESVRWDIAILDLQLDSVQISQLIFVLAIPFLKERVTTIVRQFCQI